MIFDITPMITPNLAVWPGDTPMSREVLLDTKNGDNITLSTLRSTVHLGAHADAPSHYEADGQTIESRLIALYVGVCQVVRVKIGRGERIMPEHVTVPITAPRVLFYTGTYPDPTNFNRDFAALSPELIDNLAGRNVRLVGIDTPSVDPFDSKGLESHHACHRHDMAILEGLTLAAVPERIYELVALPLKLQGCDASPVRAILRAIPEI
ncbi:MAG: cyclase family protein [Gemmataceae bacterium]